MEAIIFSGLQASGKSSFYKERFFSTHVRISLDLLRTRHRERRLLSLCIETQQPFVVDNTNPTRKERSNYIEAARSAGFAVTGYYFCSIVADCLVRNKQRTNQVADVGILATARKLELPAIDEGFDSLKYVRMNDTGFVIEEWLESSEDRRHDIRRPGQEDASL